MRESGEVPSRDYTTQLEGGKKYYVYFVYGKSNNGGSGEDKFTINSVALESKSAGESAIVVTNSNGEAFYEPSEYGAYKVKEIKAPPHYIMTEEEKEVELVSTEKNQSVTFTNNAIKFAITTEVGVNVSGSRTGGTITGEYTSEYAEENHKKLSEKVVEASNATKDIVITPTTGYKVESIKINNKNYEFTPDGNGNVVIPKSKFTNVTKNQHIVVTFGEEEQTVTIVKTDKNTGEPLEGAKFKFTSNFEREQNLDYLISEMYKGNDDYYFTYNESNGTYTNNNQYQDSTVALGYKIVDLTNIEGSHTLTINAKVSSESNCDYGYVVISELGSSIATGTSSSTSSSSSTASATSSTSDSGYSYDDLNNPTEIFKISGDESSCDYTYELEGGKKYIVYFAYGKDGGSSNGTDTFTINSVHLDNANGPIVAESGLTDENGIATVKLTGYGEYTVEEIVTPDGYKTMDNMTYELSASDRNPTLNIENILEGVVPVTYTVNYFEKGTTTAIHDAKTSEELDVGTEITSANEVIDIDGYVFDSASPEILTLGENSVDNVINLYYTKRNDLSYTVNYLEKDNATNVLHAPTTVQNKTFEDVITSANEAIEIDGYVYDSASPVTLTIGVNAENNVINLYYTKRNNLSYTVNYLEKDNVTNVLHIPTTVQNKTFEDVITSANEAIEIDGYVYDSASPETLTIGVNAENNVINLYYIKRNDLTYTVHYREQGVDGEAGKLADDKVVNGQTFGDVIPESAIDIDGFEKVTPTSANVEITAGTNEYTFYYTRRTDLSYTIHHVLRARTRSVTYVREDITVGNQTFGDVVTVNAIDVPGYRKLDPTSAQITITTGTNEHTFYYEQDDFTYTVHYFYDGVEDEDEVETLTGMYKEVITTYEDKVKTGYVLERAEPVDATTGELALEITSNPVDNVINVFYRTQYTVSTEVVSHTETDKDGTVRNNVTGGSISGAGQASYEDVYKGNSTTKDIVITPATGYDITSIKVNDTAVEFAHLLNNGSVTLNAENGFFSNMDSNKHVKAEFRKKSNVVVKYLEKDTNEELVSEDTISGHEGKAFETESKAVNYYRAVSITDEDGNAISDYERITSDDKLSANGTMYADTLTIIYWYERIPAGIIVKHIAINELDKDNLTLASGEELDEEVLNGYASLTENTYRKIYSESDSSTAKYKDYIAVDGPTSASANITIVGAEENSKIATYVADATVEVRYYYEKQYKVTTEVVPHDEVNESEETVSVAGGTISGVAGEVYEVINDKGYNTKEIVITPDAGYRAKQITINGEICSISEFNVDATTGVVTIPAGAADAYFTRVSENKHVAVEFERIPATVIVKYKDVATDEEVIGVPEKVVEGYIGKGYNEPAIDVPGYIRATPTAENPEPISEGVMGETPIEIVHWYIKQFMITTQSGEGGTVSLEGDVESETVNRGDSNTLKITIKPKLGYKLDKIFINDEELDYKNDPSIVKKLNSIEIPERYFTNIQENKYIAITFEKIADIPDDTNPKDNKDENPSESSKSSDTSKDSESKPEPRPAKETQKNTHKSKSVKTGDIVICYVAMLISAGVVMVIAIKKK